MLTLPQIDYLIDNGYAQSYLRTDSVYWIYSEHFNIAVKENVFELYAQAPGVLVLLCTVCVPMSLEDFIVLLDAFNMIPSPVFIPSLN